MADPDQLDAAIRKAEELGGWPQYAVFMCGMADTGDNKLDAMLAGLYLANEQVYRRANQLALRHDLRMMND